VPVTFYREGPWQRHYLLTYLLTCLPVVLATFVAIRSVHRQPATRTHRTTLECRLALLRDNSLNYYHSCRVASSIFLSPSLFEAISLALSDFGNLLMCSAFCTFLIFCSVEFDMLHETLGSACILRRTQLYPGGWVSGSPLKCGKL